jgi:chromosome segregation ATPase
MTNEEIAVELARQGQHIKSNTHRIDELEEQQKETRALVRSVDKLAQSMENMVREQERQGKQIDALESSRSDTFKYWLRTILTAAATGIIGYALAAFLQK